MIVTASLAFGAVPFVQKTYEIRAGQESGKGIPMITYIAMSMQEGLREPGSWRGYHVIMFLENDYDYSETSEQTKKDVEEAISRFLNNPKYMLDFYTRKVSYQWTEGTFDGTLWGIKSAFGEIQSPWIISILNREAYNFFVVVGNWHQCVVYLAFMISMFFTLLDIRKKRILTFEKCC